MTAVITPKSRPRKRAKPRRPRHRKPRWGDVVNGEKVYNLHPGQSQVMRSERRFTAAIAGTGGGKTVLGPLWIAKRIKTLLAQGITTGLIGMIVAPTYKVLSRATVPTLIETFRGTDLQGRFLESKGHYVLPRGMGILYLLSAENPDGLEGGQLNIGAWLDEAGQMSERSWLALCRRTGVNEAPIFITTTPYLSNWLKLEFLDRFLKGDKDYFAAIWPSIQNPAYPIREYERAKRTLTKAVFDMMYNGLFTSLAGMVFPDFHLCVCPSYSPVGRLLGGMDFGWRAPFAALGATLYIENGKDILYVWYERYETKCRLVNHQKWLPNGMVWFADPSRPDDIVDLRAFGHRVVGARNDVKLGIEAVNARILTGRLKVSEACANLIREAGVYKYPEEGEDENPEEGLDHAMDALRYLCLSITRKMRHKKKPQVIVRRCA